MVVSGILLQPVRNSAKSKLSAAGGIRDIVCLLFTGSALYTVWGVSAQ